MGPETFFAIAVLGGMIFLLVRETMPSFVVLGGGLFLFLVAGLVSPEEAVSGLSSRATVTVALVFMVVAGVYETGAVKVVQNYLLKMKRTEGIPSAVFRITFPVAVLSAFLNNTPIVAMFAPMVKRWAELRQIPSSKFLIPLSYASIMGGMCTLVGTATNLIVDGMMRENGMQGLSMFELAMAGVPCAAAGILYLVFAGHRILPERKDIIEEVRQKGKEYSVGMRVSGECPFIGHTIEEAGLRNLRGVYLIEIHRGKRTFGPVSPKERVREGDIFYFVGNAGAVADLNEIPGLVISSHKMFDDEFTAASSHFVEAVVSESSPLLGRTVKETDFRKRYSAGVIAIHRNGRRVEGKIGDIRLRAGDVLFLLARDRFTSTWAGSRDFYLVSTVRNKEEKKTQKAGLAAVIFIFMIAAVALGGMLPGIQGEKISIFYAAAVACALMVFTGCLSLGKAKKALRPDVLLTIAFAIGISKALDNSGVTDLVSRQILLLNGFTGPLGVLAAVYAATVIFSTVITNKTAVVLMFPVALSAALNAGADPKPFMVSIALASASCFASPVGYQTNLIVQGAGGYKFRDFLKAGVPLNLIFFAISMLLIPLFWPL
ncbi:MAG: SLC13 family permease [Candidatus Omnitrophica bacterium]|nr:SLC13 family permease [Candidatus Omnitrophota bacterium]